MSSRPLTEVSRKLGNFKYFGRFLSAGLDLIFPPLCDQCESSEGPWAISTLCRVCFLKVLHPARVSLPGLSDTLIIAAAEYEGPLKKWIPRAKFHSDPLALRAVEVLLAEAAKTTLPFPPDLITYIPGHPDHLRERGVSVPRWLARRVSRTLDVPLIHRLLERKGNPRAQTKLRKRERARNMEDAFHVRNSALPETVLLVDDVITTGATIRAAVTAMKEAGIQNVFVLVAAHTPLANEKREEIASDSRTMEKANPA